MMLNVDEVGAVLGFLDTVVVTGRNQARNLSIVCAKLEAHRDRLVDAELRTKFAPPPAPIADNDDDKDLEESTKDQINKDLYPEGEDRE